MPYLQSWILAQTGLCTPSKSALKAYQLRQINKVLLYTKQNSAFYAKHSLKNSVLPLKNWQAFEQLPFLTAQTLTQFAPQMLCVSQGDIERVRTLATSGTTGPAKRIYFTRHDLNQTIDFFKNGMQPFVQKNKPVAILIGNNSPDGIAHLLQQALLQLQTKPSIITPNQPYKTINATLQALQPYCIVGVAAQLLYLCQKNPYLRPKTVLLSADYVSPSIIATLQKKWQCTVVTHYGLTETAYGFAVQCPQQGGLHLRAANFYAEIIDPATQQVLPVGHAGELVLTSLCQQALPLIRYKTGDKACLQAGTCACGSVLPRLQGVYGRYQNNNNQAPRINTLDDILFGIEGLCAYNAFWQNKVLHLQIEGTMPNQSWLAQQLGVPVYCTHKKIDPFLQSAKRVITNTRGETNG